jgi:hypothetical protein
MHEIDGDVDAGTCPDRRPADVIETRTRAEARNDLLSHPAIQVSEVDKATEGSETTPQAGA